MTTADYEEGSLPSPEHPLSVIFYDINDPLDKTFWAGTSAHIIHRLREAGHTVTVVGPHLPRLRRVTTSVLYHFYNRLFRRYYHVDRDRFWTWVYTQVGNLKLLFQKRADAVITCSPPFTAYLRSREPIFLLHDGTWTQMLETYPHLSPDRQVPRIVNDGIRLDDITFRRPDLSFVLASQWAANRVMKDYGTDPARINVLPFGANFSVDPTDAEVAEGIAARGVPPCKLLFVGRDWMRKGGPLAVEICKSLQDAGIDVELHVVGCSPMDLPAFARVHGLLSKNDPAQRAALETLYRESDFFLLPAAAEAQGIVFNEAAAYGLPVIATDVGGISSVVKQDVWGVLFAPDTDAATYAARIQQIYTNRELYRSMCASARQDYLRRLSGSQYVTELVSIIRQRTGK